MSHASRLLAFALVAALSACGGSVSGDSTPGDSGSTEDTGTSTDGGPIDGVTSSDSATGSETGAIDSATTGADATTSTCPTPAPTLGTACVGDVKCAYEPACPDGTTKLRSGSYACTGGAWTDTAGGPTCAETYDAGAPPCPTTEPTAGSGCAWYSQTCIYGDASKCHSYRCTHIGWVGPTPDCLPGCPAKLPAAGAACASPGLVCPGYDDARPGCGSTANCTSSGWKVAPPTMTCPYPP